MPRDNLLEEIELREQVKLAHHVNPGAVPFYAHYRNILGMPGVQETLDRNIEAAFRKEPGYLLVGPLAPGAARENPAAIPENRKYAIRKAEYYKIQRQYLQEASYYSDAYRIKDGFKKADEALKNGTFTPRNSVLFAALGEYMVQFLDTMRGGTGRFDDYEIFVAAKNPQPGDFWYNQENPGEAPKTNQHYAAFYAELINAIPTDKRTNEADFCAAFLSQHLINTASVAIIDTPSMSNWLALLNVPADRNALAALFGVPAANLNARTLYKLLIQPGNIATVNGHINNLRVAGDARADTLALDVAGLRSGWRAFLDPAHPRRDELFTALGVTAATITDDESLYKAIINALTDDTKRAALTRFIEDTTPGHQAERNQYRRLYLEAEDTKVRTQLELELNIISNARRLYVYANPSYDYAVMGEDKLTNNNNYNRFKAAIAAEPASATYTAAVNQYEQRIRDNQNYRRMPISQDSIKVKLGTDLYAAAAVLGLTRPPGLNPADPPEVNNAKYATFAKDIIDRAFPGPNAAGQGGVAIPTAPNKFAAAFLMGTSNTAWVDALIANVTVRDQAIALLNALPIIDPDRHPVTPANFTKELLFEYLWTHRNTHAGQIQAFARYLNPAGAAPPARFSAAAAAAGAAEIDRICGIPNDTDVTKYRHVLALDREIATKVTEAPPATDLATNKEHKEKVDKIDISLDHTTRMNRIDELLLLNAVAIEQLRAELNRAPVGIENAPGANDQRRETILNRINELVINASELRSIKVGGRFIRAGKKTIGSILSNVFGPWSHPSNFAHNTKDGDIWGPTVTRMENGMTTFYAVVQTPSGNKRYKLVDAYDVDDFLSPLGSTFTNFFLKNSQIDKEAVFEATLKRHRFIIENNGLIRATDEDGNPDKFGRFTTHRSAYYTSINAYNQILNGHNAKNMFGNIFVLLYLGAPLFAISVVFVGLSWIVTGIYSLLGGGSWDQPGLAKNLLYSPVKDNPFTWLTKRLWTSPHQEAEIGLARQTCDLFIEQKMGTLFSDFYVMSTSAKEFETQIKTENRNGSPNTAQDKAKVMLKDFEKEFQAKVDKILDPIRRRGGNPTDDQILKAKETVLMNDIKLTPKQREHWERQVITYKADQERKNANNTPEEQQPGHGLMHGPGL